MRARSFSNLVGEPSPNPTSSNPKHRNCRRSKQPFILKESPVDTMVDQRTMTEWLRAPTEGYAEAIVVPPILAEHFELKHSHVNMMTSNQFFKLKKDNPHDHIRWFNKITSTITYKDEPNSEIKLMLFPFSLAWATRRWLEKEPPPKLTHAVNQQTSVVTTAMTVILKQFQATSPPVFVKPVEEICVTCGGAHPYYQCLAANDNTFLKFRDNIQGYVSAAANIMASFFQMNIAFTAGSRPLPSNTIANPKGELKAITTRSGLVLDRPSVPMPLPFINPEEYERAEETLMDQDLAEKRKNKTYSKSGATPKLPHVVIPMWLQWYVGVLEN
nr:reverse transcriptase domain-containing protein [Tanacetum cinerariifolium]